MIEHEPLTLIATLKILFPMRLVIPFLVIIFSLSVATTGHHKGAPVHKAASVQQQKDSTFIQKLVQPITHPPKPFK